MYIHAVWRTVVSSVTVSANFPYAKKEDPL